MPAQIAAIVPLPRIWRSRQTRIAPESGKYSVSSLSYMFNKTSFSREAFSSYPHNVLAFRLSSSDAGMLNFNVSLTRDKNVTELSADATTATLLLEGST